MSVQEGDSEVELAARRVAQLEESEEITDPARLAKAVLTTVYMGTVNSSGATRERAQQLAREVRLLLMALKDKGTWGWCTLCEFTRALFIDQESACMVAILVRRGGEGGGHHIRGGAILQQGHR